MQSNKKGEGVKIIKMSNQQAFMIVLALAVTATGLMYFQPIPGEPGWKSGNTSLDTQARTGAKTAGTNVNKIYADVNRTPITQQNPNTSQWFIKNGLNLFYHGTEHLWNTDRYRKEFNDGVMANVLGVPQEVLLTDLQTTHRNPTFTGRFNQSTQGLRDAGVVSLNGLDFNISTKKWLDPTADDLPVSIFNRGRL